AAPGDRGGPVRRYGDLLRPRRTRGPPDDVLDRGDPGQRGAGPRRDGRAPLAAGPSARPDAGRRLRQLSADARRPERLGVRPRGWLEMRMFDGLPDPWWRVPVAVTAALLFDEEAGETARVVSKAAEGMWSEAARHGLSHPALADAARGAFAAALEALPRIG